MTDTSLTAEDTEPTTMADAAYRHFVTETADHTMTVLHASGLWRHLRFHNGHNAYWFDIVTWPGVLVINGEMGSYTFATGDPDVTRFFRGKTSINPGYWCQKVRGDMHLSEYSEEVFREHVTYLAAEHAEEFPGLPAAVQSEIVDQEDEYLTEDNARYLADRWEYFANEADRSEPGRAPDFRFTDVWEWDLNGHTYAFLWCCHAIVWGIARYDDASASLRENRAATPPAEALCITDGADWEDIAARVGGELVNRSGGPGGEPETYLVIPASETTSA